MSYESDDGYRNWIVRRRRRRESCQSFTCISPWFIIFHWFSGDKSKSSGEKWEKKKGGGVFDIKRNFRLDEKEMDTEASSSSKVAASAKVSKEDSINLGVGFGLVYLAATRRNEVNKMAGLHKKVELLLQNFKTEYQNQDKSKSSSTSVSNAHVQNDNRPETGIRSDYRREKSLRMDHLEAELVAEFDRLQLQTDTDSFSNYTNKINLEVNIEDSAPEESQSTSFEEIITEQPDYNEFYSVPASELKRRLYEVLEERQNERIDELESSLEFAMHQLDEKERELSWWKDTARLISQHLPDMPSLLMRHEKQPIVEDRSKILSLTYEKSLV